MNLVLLITALLCGAPSDQQPEEPKVEVPPPVIELIPICIPSKGVILYKL